MTVLDDIISLRVSVCNVTSDHCPALLLSQCHSVTDITLSQCPSVTVIITHPRLTPSM